MFHAFDAQFRQDDADEIFYLEMEYDLPGSDRFCIHGRLLRYSIENDFHYILNDPKSPYLCCID